MVETVELKPGGESIAVTEENKREYVVVIIIIILFLLFLFLFLFLFLTFLRGVTVGLVWQRRNINILHQSSFPPI